MVLVKKLLKWKQPDGKKRHNLAAKTADVTWPGAAEQSWDQNELIDLCKSSGKFPPFPFQCWASSAIDVQVSARKTDEGEAAREGMRLWQLSTKDGCWQ